MLKIFTLSTQEENQTVYEKKNLSRSETFRRKFKISIMAENGDVNPSNPNSFIVRGQEFLVGPRYINLSHIGEGAYGVVV